MRQSTKTALDVLFASHPVLKASDLPVNGEVESLETELDRALDEAHREFVLSYGGATVGSLPIIGLRESETVGHGTLLEVNRSYRDSGWPDEVAAWLICSIDLAGNPIGYDAQGEVWTYDHDAGETVRVASCFEDFLVSCLEGR